MKTLLRGALMTAVALGLGATAPARAATSWTDWTSATDGHPGSAAGTLNGIGVAYSGEIYFHTINGTSPFWSPDSSFIGGTVTTSPSTVKDAIFLQGLGNTTRTLTFDSPILNPVFAIWSLGAPGIPAKFVFGQAPTLQAGGPNSAYGGSSITVNGTTVSGIEGNGVLQFAGLVSSISWTNTAESYYGFTVGMNGSIVPLPATLSLMATGLAGLGLLRRRRAR